MDIERVSNLPLGKKAIKSKWVFKTKLNSDGVLECCKVKLVAKRMFTKARH